MRLANSATIRALVLWIAGSVAEPLASEVDDVLAHVRLQAAHTGLGHAVSQRVLVADHRFALDH